MLSTGVEVELEDGAISTPAMGFMALFSVLTLTSGTIGLARERRG